MNGSQSILRRLIVAATTVCVVLLFGASGAHAAPALTLGPLVAENHDTGDEEDNSEEDSSDEDSEDEDNSDEDSEDEDNSDEDSSDEDSDEDEPTDEPTSQPTFTDPPTTDATDITEMPTQDADASSEAGASPLGWILLAGGVVCAGAAVAVYRRNRHIM